jgi:PQQ-like domain
MSHSLSSSSFLPSLRISRPPKRTASPLLLAYLSCLALLFNSCGKEKKDSSSRNRDSAGPHIKWQYKSSGSALSHPAVGPDGIVYVGSNRGLIAVSPDGKLLWETTLSATGTPVLGEDGTIYLNLWHGLILGVSKEGKTVWHPGYGLIGFGAPPALGPDTTLYFLNSASDIYAFQPRLSDEKFWSLETFREGALGASTFLPGTARSNGTIPRSAPLVTTTGSIILPRQNFIDSISSHGSLEWDLELTSGSLGQAALASDGTIYVGDDKSVFYAVNSGGEKKWQLDAGGSVIGSPVIDADGVIYFTDGIALFAVSPDGAIRWRYAPPQRIHLLTSPALATDGTIYVGGEFALLALHPDGTLKWNLRIYSPTSAAAIGTDGVIYFACGYSWLCAVEDSGSPLMPSAWPKQFHDLANTSNTLHGPS